MTIEIRCSAVHISKEEWGYLIAWGADENPEEQYLMLQAADEYSDEDIRLGMNDIYIECCGQGWSWYGHIESFTLSRHRVDVQLDAVAAERMRDNGSVMVHFAADEGEYGKLRDTLRHVFNGRPYFKEA